MVVVEGEPIGKGRPRVSSRSGTVYTPRKTVAYEDALRFAAKLSKDRLGTAPAIAIIRAFSEPPTSWSQKKKKVAVGGRVQKITKPDIDNVVKSALDGIPPYNIEKSDDNHYRITLALAGFRQEDLEIQLEGTRLSVKGTPEQPKEEKKWLHQGLMNQPFSLSFTLAENMEVSGATFVNGLLHIDLIRNEPEPIAAQRIAISERPALNS